MADSILNQIDELIEKGVYSDRTDFITQAVFYELHKDEIRFGIQETVLTEVDKMIERRLDIEKYLGIIQIKIKEMMVEKDY